MKSLKLVAVSLLAAASVSIASAQTFVKITGSTAFRKSTYNAIVNSLNNPKGAAIGGTVTDITGQTQVVITGTLKSGPSAGQAVVFQAAFGGSTGGLQVVTQGLTTIPGTSFDAAHTWLSSTANTLTPLTVSAGAISGATVLAAGTANFDAAATANVTMADSFQSSTAWTTPAVASEPLVGAVAYYWVKGLRSPDVSLASYNALTNITSQQGALLLAAGSLPLSVFTGNAADAGINVDLIGRNDDSGTRTIVQCETSQGAAPIQTQQQYRNHTPGSATITQLDYVGDVGYDSGGKVATDLKTPIASGVLDPNGAHFILVGYAGKSDKNTAVAGGAVALAYNGVDGTVDANINNGSYSYWAYEHIDAKAGLSAVQTNAIALVTSDIVNNTATLNGVTLSALQVSRVQDGTVVSP
jgi:hypothetical protein